MKKQLITLVFSLFSIIVFAQSSEIVRIEYHSSGQVKLRFQQISKTLVHATYYYENGVVAETGYFLNKELYGYWETFDVNSRKIASGFYQSNRKTGTWNYWNEGEISNTITFSGGEMAIN